ncbi:MAG: hypothetical protein OXB96_00610 [Candidatus Kaiserbacteria bacterium]|nr:hypothetical protein [Candidatus Kaiserbacteria bacterium]
MQHEETLERLITLFKRFPGIGLRQAERFARFIAQQDASYIQHLTASITALHRASKQCPQCFIRHQQQTVACPICDRGNTDTLIVVEKDADAYMLAASTDAVVQGYYFILGGLVPIANSNQTSARIPQLITSVKTHSPKEIIIALAVHPDADHTGRHLSNLLKQQFPAIAVSTLGRGLSSGSELEYSDPETLINAVTHRNPFP